MPLLLLSFHSPDPSFLDLHLPPLSLQFVIDIYFPSSCNVSFIPAGGTAISETSRVLLEDERSREVLAVLKVTNQSAKVNVETGMNPHRMICL